MTLPMETIIIKTQQEFDALPQSFSVFTVIEIRADQRISVSKNRENSSVEARGNSSVVAWENSSVEAWENSSVVARGNSSVVARENSSVEARGNSSVEAWGNSSVEAWENSSVEAWGNSSVVAWGNSSVECYDFVMVSVLMATVVIKKLMDWSVASCRGFKPKIGKKSKTATVITTPVEIKHKREDFFDRCEASGKDAVILYKSVNPKNLSDFQTGKIKYEGIVECSDWNPNPNIECGGGLHLSPTKGMALSYNVGKVLRCKVEKKDIVVYAKNLTKCRCKKVKVLDDQA